MSYFNSRHRKNVKKRLWKRAGGIGFGPSWSHEEYGRCVYCQTLFTLSSLTIDHVVPISKGGTNNIHNLVLACRDCNHSKGDSYEHDKLSKSTN
jgi:5-methylcytosine-specific restriction endonuclease McrA